jgi:hypothetical protein
MADCRIVYNGVTNALTAIQTSSKGYLDAGNEFISAFTNAINEMEGEAKDALDTLIKGQVTQFVTEGIPKALDGMHELLNENLNNFVKVDSDIANSIKP